MVKTSVVKTTIRKGGTETITTQTYAGGKPIGEPQVTVYGVQTSKQGVSSRGDIVIARGEGNNVTPITESRITTYSSKLGTRTEQALGMSLPFELKYQTPEYVREKLGLENKQNQKQTSIPQQVKQQKVTQPSKEYLFSYKDIKEKVGNIPIVRKGYEWYSSQTGLLLERQKEAEKQREQTPKFDNVLLEGSKIFPEGLPEQRIESGLFGGAISYGFSYIGDFGEWLKQKSKIGSEQILGKDITTSTVEKKREEYTEKLEDVQSKIEELNKKYPEDIKYTELQINKYNQEYDKLDKKQNELINKIENVEQEVSPTIRFKEGIVTAPFNLIQGLVEPTKYIGMTSTKRKELAQFEREQFAMLVSKDPFSFIGSTVGTFLTFEAIGFGISKGVKGVKAIENKIVDTKFGRQTMDTLGLVKQDKLKTKTQFIIEETEPQSYIEFARKGGAKGIAESKYYEIKDVILFEEPSKATFRLKLKEPEEKISGEENFFVRDINVPKEKVELYKDILLPVKPAEARFLFIKSAEIDVGKVDIKGFTDEYLFIRKGSGEEGKGGMLDESSLGFKRTRLIKEDKVLKESYETIEPSINILGEKYIKSDIAVGISRKTDIGKVSKDVFGAGGYEVVELGLLSKDIGKGKLSINEKSVGLIKRYKDINQLKRVETKPIPFSDVFKEIEKGEFTPQYKVAQRESGIEIMKGKFKGGDETFDWLRPKVKNNVEKERIEEFSKYQKTPEYKSMLSSMKPMVTSKTFTPIDFGNIEELSKGFEVEYTYGKGIYYGERTQNIGTERIESIEFSKIDSLIRLESRSESQLKIESKSKPELQLRPQVKMEIKSELKPELQLRPELKFKPELKLKPQLKLVPEIKIELTPSPMNKIPFALYGFSEKMKIKETKKEKKQKQQFFYVPNIAGLVFGESLIKEPLGSKVFKGLELRPQTEKPLSISPFKKSKFNLLGTPKAEFYKRKKKSSKEKSKEKRMKKSLMKPFKSLF